MIHQLSDAIPGASGKPRASGDDPAEAVPEERARL